MCFGKEGASLNIFRPLNHILRILFLVALFLIHNFWLYLGGLHFLMVGWPRWEGTSTGT